MEENMVEQRGPEELYGPWIKAKKAVGSRFAALFESHEVVKDWVKPRSTVGVTWLVCESRKDLGVARTGLMLFRRRVWWGMVVKQRIPVIWDVSLEGVKNVSSQMKVVEGTLSLNTEKHVAVIEV
ncbi:hypothetical protein V6N13_008028 [Hibiscus sabdariffa]|uniref:Uncharacterized protein n=1 Tax=Hibiscus sabdariffa TaxID=183260 RepID=A0ABR2EC40_9ROSI